MLSCVRGSAEGDGIKPTPAERKRGEATRRYNVASTVANLHEDLKFNRNDLEEKNPTQKTQVVYLKTKTWRAEISKSAIELTRKGSSKT